MPVLTTNTNRALCTAAVLPPALNCHIFCRSFDLYVKMCRKTGYIHFSRKLGSQEIQKWWGTWRESKKVGEGEVPFVREVGKFVFSANYLWDYLNCILFYTADFYMDQVGGITANFSAGNSVEFVPSEKWQACISAAALKTCERCEWLNMSRETASLGRWCWRMD